VREETRETQNPANQRSNSKSKNQKPKSKKEFASEILTKNLIKKHQNP
jgi:hypothetical protein